MPLRIEPVRDRKLYRLIKSAPERSTRKGEVVFAQGESAGSVFLVETGHVCLKLGRTSESARTVAVAGPYELFGEEGMVPGSPRPYSAVAGERGTVIPLDGPTVRAILRSSQHTLTAYLEVKERDLEVLRRAATGSPGPSARERLAGVIVDLVARLGEPDGERIRLPHWFTHKELADLAGAHRSTVTTSLNDWIWRGVLATRGRSLMVTRTGLATLRAEGEGQPSNGPRGGVGAGLPSLEGGV
jgi:CRP/FNR family cyclic AMP-dependent transcriptional regulator